MNSEVRSVAIDDEGRSERGSAVVMLARRLVLAKLARIQHGDVTLIEPDGTTHRFGQCDDECKLPVTIHSDDPELFVDIAFGGTVGAGEAYMKGRWRCDDLVALIRLFIRNRDVLTDVDGGWSWLSRPLLAAFHHLRRNTRAGSLRNIAAHYDLGNDLYKLMLDETMAYSCGIFRTPDSTLYEASVEKFDAACRKLQLGPNDRVLEIGCGWGGFALHAVTRYGCHVTATTISRQQYDLARQRIDAAGVSDRVTLLLSDYRDLQGQFDKIVSIEMIEAVGANYLDTYTATCSRLLKPDGAMLLQAITLRDQLYRSALRSVDFIQRYIFPGSFIPSITAILQSFAAQTDMKAVHLEDIGPHYATTLRRWRQGFTGNLSQVRQLGYPDTFIRMWEFYLCYCEGGFLERQLGDVQILFAKPGCRLPVGA
ncbi:cyclopropane-fatty-acyl-phospholipid synthase [Povalibacter uvarum]|uniref:Cyclopropane-fatty-acyl-phospholipid synthase n=1 Tax=Povalibacter uvarum TaxID=732238 RepID=A0A841HI73_9GAMM|nr:cyclopropane-fatty-acyl-phospholipid synthase family protein [Povalibacter uvarum]MBB6092403.1 cyclopropane-fatty-acyl-phospholipid synthase [Povalibacter uvarum]